MSAYGAVNVDGIGRILVEHEVLDRYPESHGIWMELGPLVKVGLEALGEAETAHRRRPHVDAYYRHFGVPNKVMRFYICQCEECCEESLDKLYVEVVVSSCEGREIRRLPIVRGDLPGYLHERRRR